MRRTHVRVDSMPSFSCFDGMSSSLCSCRILKQIPRSATVRDEGEDAPRAELPQLPRGLAQRAGGVDDVVHDDAVPVLHLCDRLLSSMQPLCSDGL